MEHLAVFSGVCRHEFRMQLHRKAMWLAFFPLAFIIAMLGTPNNAIVALLTNPAKQSLLDQILAWAHIINMVFPIGVGIILADRVRRDRQTRVEELLITTPAQVSARILGKYLGSIGATLIPIGSFYLFGIFLLALQHHSLFVFIQAILVFLITILPGMIFISAFALTCPVFIPIPLYWFLFLGYWFWGNLLPPSSGIPSLSSTILTPLGGYISVGFFGGTAYPIFSATPWQAGESLFLLLGIATLVMLFLCLFLQRQYLQK
jgi:ABC-2 type transport system permease protein